MGVPLAYKMLYGLWIGLFVFFFFQLTFMAGEATTCVHLSPHLEIVITIRQVSCIVSPHFLHRLQNISIQTPSTVVRTLLTRFSLDWSSNAMLRDVLRLSHQFILGPMENPPSPFRACRLLVQLKNLYD